MSIIQVLYKDAVESGKVSGQWSKKGSYVVFTELSLVGMPKGHISSRRLSDSKAAFHW